MEEKEFQAILAQKLKTLLLKSGKKQKHLAEGMGVTTSFIGNFFNERDKASVYRVNQMLESMGKPSLLEWLDTLIKNEPGKKTPKLRLTCPESRFEISRTELQDLDAKVIKKILQHID